MSQTATAAVSYFGKIPARGDFVRTADDHQLMALLDRWAGSSIELLARNPDWKRLYDATPGVAYAFLGSRSRLVVCGHLRPSHDASSRRFPLLSAIRLEVGQPLAFLARSPLALSRVWAGLSRLSANAVTADAPEEPLRTLGEARYELAVDPLAYQAPFEDFLDMETIGSLQARLRDAGHAEVSLRHMLPALGLLLQPLLTGGGISIDKGLELPLPTDSLHRPLVAAFWLDLVAGFIARGDFELAVLVRDESGPRLVIGFNGAQDQVLGAVLDPSVAADYLIRGSQAGWVEDYLPGDYALNRLASYLDRDDLSLKTARKLFCETFLGT